MMLSRTALLTALVAGLSIPAFAADPAPSVPPVPAVDTPATAAPSVSLEGLAVGTAVVDRALQGAASSFSTGDAPRLYCYNKVTTAGAPTTLTHVWIQDGTERGTITLNIGGSPWRTWSNHAVSAGSWKVEVRDAAGSVVDSVSFTVTEGAPAPAVPTTGAAPAGSGY